ncbi:MAG: cell envelope integrity protein TolA [Gammaproteobacteria bacterium]|nr:cell envelope integrity protein TolA [Gammaproteobacteria bacterium]
MSKKSFLQMHSGSTLLSVGMHLALLSLFLVGVRFAAEPLYPVATEEVAIQATVVDEALIEREIARIEEQEQAKILRRQEEERQAREQAEAAQRELEEQQRQLELARQEQAQQEEEERQRLTELQQQREAEEQRRLEAQRQAEEAERQRIEEEQRLAQQREEEERRRREEEERRQREEQERLAREAEERRLEQERLAREAEEARQRAEMEAELRRAMAAEEERRAAEDAGLLDQYILLIQDRIERAWNPPPSAGPGLQCEVSVTQIPSGDVTSVSVGRCNGDVAVIRSIEQAVQRASPLPPPPTPSLFSRNLELIFQPDG